MLHTKESHQSLLNFIQAVKEVEQKMSELEKLEELQRKVDAAGLAPAKLRACAKKIASVAPNVSLQLHDIANELEFGVIMTDADRGLLTS